MASQRPPPKGILKKTSQQDQAEIDNTSQLPSHLRELTTTLPPYIRAADPTHLATALTHAAQIALRKDLETLIFSNLETLLDYPRTQCPATQPAYEDIASIKQLLAPFQPSDYDSLIEERNINERCAYVLCPLQCPPPERVGGYRILGASGATRDFRIVKAREYGRWCSEDCKRRALYIKVQLSEMPAWERRDNAPLELLGEREMRSEEERRAEMLADQVGAMEIREKRPWEQQLAGERGEDERSQAARLGLIKDEVMERSEPMRQAMPPQFDDEQIVDGMRGLHLVDGYASRFTGR